MESRYSVETRSKSKQKMKPSTSGEDSSQSQSKLDSENVLGNETIGYIFSHSPPIVERIFEHLPMKLLNKCAHVCKLWNTMVQAIKRKRRDVFWMFKVHASSKDEHVAPKDPKQAVYATSSAHDVGKHFHETLKKVNCEPKFGILFCTDKITGTPNKYFHGYGKVLGEAEDTMENLAYDISQYNQPLMLYLSKFLPHQCKMLGCVTTGLVGTATDLSQSVELEHSVGISSLFFPDIPGLEVYQFAITDMDIDAFCDIGHRDLAPKLDEDMVACITGIPKEKEVKCLLIFMEDLSDAQGLTRSVLEFYLQKQKLQIALGGALVEEIVSPNKTNDDSRQVAVGVAFAGENVSAASLILEPSVRKPQQVLEKLNKLKACKFPESNPCVAFVFACCGRGASFYGKPNVEAETFHKVFPNVPLFGFYGNGEIGLNYWPNVATSSRTTVSPDDLTVPWFHSYTTIFVLLSWPKK